MPIDEDVNVCSNCKHDIVKRWLIIPTILHILRLMIDCTACALRKKGQVFYVSFCFAVWVGPLIAITMQISHVSCNDVAIY